MSVQRVDNRTAPRVFKVDEIRLFITSAAVSIRAKSLEWRQFKARYRLNAEIVSHLKLIIAQTFPVLCVALLRYALLLVKQSIKPTAIKGR